MLKKKITNKQRIKQIAKLEKEINKTNCIAEDWLFCIHISPIDYKARISVWNNKEWVERDENNEPNIMSVYLDLNGQLLSADERLTQEQIDEAIKNGKEWLKQE